MHKNTTVFLTVLATLLLGACSSGGSAGDDADPDAVALITPLVGVYQLPPEWAGQPESEAYLEIQEPAATGTAPVILFRLSDTNNCIEPSLSQGEATKDPFSQSVFLDGLFDFGSATLSLAGDTLVIGLSEDVNDTNNNGDFTDSATLLAPAFFNDLPSICE